MNLTRTIKDLENVYIEKVNFPPKGTFELAKDAKEKKKPFISKPSGPAETSGFQKEISDPKTLKGEETFQGTEKLSSQNFNEKSEKSEQKVINNFMSKSIFDKLFEDVMGVQGADTEAKDALDLGIDTGAAAEHNAEEGDITLTLPRDVAQKLCDMLHEVLETGSEEKAEHEAEAETEAETEGESEDNQEVVAVAGEGTEMTEVKPAAGQALAGKNNKVSGVATTLVAKGAGDAKVTDKVGNDGEKGHALVGAGVKGAEANTGKNNKVANKHNVGDYLFKK
jgi:hypothetical protein